MTEVTPASSRTLRLFDTMSRDKRLFEPLDPAHIRMYVCGPTVYDRAHVGNARPVVVFDVLYRLLSRLYPSVTYVRNITDVDDKINARAQETGEPIAAITERTTAYYHEDMDALNALRPDEEPRATAHIAEMIHMITQLIDKGHAYAAEGHVLFSVPSLEDYGALSRRSREDLIDGARVEVAPYKRDAADFVLWKPSSDDLPGWDSPWGRGRPGWHIECSAMSSRYLGPSFDIHGGGQDLVFPHHENEIAQSVGCNGTGTYARYWVHNGHVMVEGEKMSKSLGNFFTVQDLLAQAPGEAIRLCMLSTHYHQPLDWTAEGLERARKAMDKFQGALRRPAVAAVAVADAGERPIPAAVMDALCDDLNTPKALADLHEITGALNKAETPEDIATHKTALLACGDILGLFEVDPESWFRGAGSAGGTPQDGLDDAAIDALIQERKDARKAKDFARADAVRDQLKEAGIILEDGPQGTTWKRG